MGLVLRGTRICGVSTCSGEYPFPLTSEVTALLLLSDLECSNGGTTLGLDIDTVAAGGDESKSENRRNIIFANKRTCTGTSHCTDSSHGTVYGNRSILSLQLVVYSILLDELFRKNKNIKHLQRGQNSNYSRRRFFLHRYENTTLVLIANFFPTRRLKPLTDYGCMNFSDGWDASPPGSKSVHFFCRFATTLAIFI